MKDGLKNLIIGILGGIIIILVVFVILVINGTISFGINKDDAVESIKVYESKDYVYDASYLYDNKYTEYGDGTGKKTVDRGITFEYSEGKQYLKDLKVPYINIKSNAADNVNDMLRDLYVEMAKNFDLYAENVNNPFISKQVLTYKTYQYKNILSVVVIFGTQATGNWNPDYDTYNFDLTNGELLSFSEGIEQLGYNDREELIKKAEEKIKNKMDELFGNFGDLTKSCYTNNGEVTNCYDVAYENFRNVVNKDNVSYFVDNDGNLDIFFVPYYSNLETGLYSYLVKISK